MSENKTEDDVKKKGFRHKSVAVFLSFLGDPLRANENIPDRVQKAHSLKSGLEEYLETIQGYGEDDSWNEVLEEVRVIGEMLCEIWTLGAKSRHPLGGSEH